jgi:hypothetical protein
VEINLEAITTLDAVAAAPEKASATDMVSGVLRNPLDGNPALQAELGAR